MRREGGRGLGGSGQGNVLDIRVISSGLSVGRVPEKRQSGWGVVAGGSAVAATPMWSSARARGLRSSYETPSLHSQPRNGERPRRTGDGPRPRPVVFGSGRVALVHRYAEGQTFRRPRGPLTCGSSRCVGPRSRASAARGLRPAMHHRVGSWAAVLTVLLTAATAVAGVATPARSGPFCGPTTWACVPAPYTDVAQFIPGDYLWLIPAILLAPVFVVLMAAIHGYAPEPRRIFTRIALAFALAYAVVIGSTTSPSSRSSSRACKPARPRVCRCSPSTTRADCSSPARPSATWR